MESPPAVHDRSSGILLHPTSLPGQHGIGELGFGAHRFSGVLAEMGQSWWQMLPVGPTGYGDSPYQSPSTFAGNPLLVSWELAVEEGLLDRSWLDRQLPPGDIDFGAVIPLRTEALAEIGRGFAARASAELVDEFDEFCLQQGEAWLDDFALYTACKRSLEHRPWWEWPPGLAHRDPEELRVARRELGDLIHRVKVEQFLFDRHFALLRHHCDRHRIGLIGDLPIFVAHDSADVWANRGLFHLDPDGQPTVVAGVPPDYFSSTGQRWGNPLYRWDRHRETGFAWWTARLRWSFSRFDLVRIDHFRGFAAYWEIPAEAPTAVEGAWVDAPGKELFDTLSQRLDTLPVLAENLGVITDDVERLRQRYRFPGMKVLQFGFTPDSDHAPEHYSEDVVAYTGTHDNDTVIGWWNDPEREPERELAREMLTIEDDEEDIHWAFIEAVMRSEAGITIIPLQDLMGLGSAARMNTPGTESGNWRWRFEWSGLETGIIERMRTLTEETGRGGS